jgi:hypothetical protein
MTASARRICRPWPAGVAALALSAVLAGCGGSSSEADTAATDDAAGVVVSDARFSASVARRVWGGFVEAYRQGRYAAAATLWPDEVRTIPGSVCRTPDELARVLAETHRADPSWPGARVRAVRAARARPHPRADVVLETADGRREAVTVGFVRQGGRWRLAEPYPVAGADRCAPPRPAG